MQFEEAADEATMRSMLAADPSLREQHADLVARMAEARNWSAVRLLIEHGLGVNAVTADGAIALHYADAAGELSIVRLLVEHGAEHTAREPGCQHYRPCSAAAGVDQACVGAGATFQSETTQGVPVDSDS